MTEASSNPKDIAARGKCPMPLTLPVAERAIADVLGHGAAKYGPWNWRSESVGLMTYVGAIMRHANAIRAGEDIDPESGLPHLAHIMAKRAHPQLSGMVAPNPALTSSPWLGTMAPLQTA
ncbi:MAG: dATP/dGTP diphosphohydrolase domain-containing protein [Planctomycetaceae bacterium]|nr:dATP/dGTP diphosphohydrolase domain-containing protein [Planctomycetaceae bacterium]